jgi:hypothetical protein
MLPILGRRVRDVTRTASIVEQIGSDKTSEIGDDSWDSPNTLDIP